MLFYEKDKLKIYNQDCLEYLNNSKENFVDIVVTSPPYNLDKKYNLYRDKITQENYINWLSSISIKIKSILKDNGSFFLNVGFRNDNPLIHFKLIEEISKTFILQNTIIWAKSITVNNEGYGHFIPNNSKKHLNNLFEYVFHFTKDGNKEIHRNSIGVPYKDKRNMERFKNNLNKGDVRCAGNIWFIPHRTIKNKQERKNHPTIFPEELVRRCVLLNGYNENTTLLDPFLGSGTSLKVCKNLNIYGIGIEIDKEYCETSKSNII
jgi:site-specific DNA-methyltransferase (adenine-specific)